MTNGGLRRRRCLEKSMTNISMGRMQGIHGIGAKRVDADLGSPMVRNPPALTAKTVPPHVEKLVKKC